MHLRYIALTIILFMAIQIGHTQNTESIEIGKKHSITSEVLSEKRAYWISLPASYHQQHNSYKRYPILILLDGHIHFKSAVGAIQFMSRAKNGSRQLPEMIIVAIMNVSRERDFTPDKIITKRVNKTGGGDNFLAFLEKELIPQIDREYRTEPYRILFGHSLGGLITVHSYLQEHSLFNAFLAIDPSFGNWDSTVMDEKIAATPEETFSRPIYIATANWGKRNIRNRDRHVRFYESMNSKSKSAYKGKLEYFENENHSTVPLPAFYNGMNYLFEGYNFSYRDATTRTALVDHYKEISTRLAYDFSPPEALVNRIGYNKLRSSDKVEKEMALAFLKLNVENYPNSYNAHDSLGEAQLKLGHNKKAIQSFEKSLALNPDNQNAKSMIVKIKDMMDNNH